MTTNDILSACQRQFPKLALEVQQGDAGDPWMLIPAGQAAEVIRFLKDDLAFNYLACLSGADFGEYLGVIYQLRNLDNKDEIMVKTLTPRQEPRVPTLAHLYGNANWFEREVYDLLGIDFTGSPDQRRIMMPDDWIGHPLRKDFQEAADYRGFPTTRPDTHRILDQTMPPKPVTEPAAGSEPTE